MIDIGRNSQAFGQVVKSVLHAVIHFTNCNYSKNPWYISMVRSLILYLKILDSRPNVSNGLEEFRFSLSSRYIIIYIIYILSADLDSCPLRDEPYSKSLYLNCDRRNSEHRNVDFLLFNVNKLKKK